MHTSLQYRPCYRHVHLLYLSFCVNTSLPYRPCSRHVHLFMLHSFLQLLNISPLQQASGYCTANTCMGEEYDCSMNPILLCYEDCLGSDFRNTLCASMSAWCSRRTNTSVSSPIRTELLCLADATPVRKCDHRHGHLRDDLVCIQPYLRCH